MPDGRSIRSDRPEAIFALRVSSNISSLLELFTQEEKRLAPGEEKMGPGCTWFISRMGFHKRELENIMVRLGSQCLVKKDTC